MDDWRQVMWTLLQSMARPALAFRSWPKAIRKAREVEIGRPCSAIDTIVIECSGLGGADLNMTRPWHMCIKT